MMVQVELKEEHAQIKELVRRFVREQLIPLERDVMARAAAGEGIALTPSEKNIVDRRAKELGLWALDVPSEFDGADLSAEAMVGVNEEIAKTVVHYAVPPDSPNLHMLIDVASPEQKEKYLRTYARGETISAMAISEPGAGSDPRRMSTKAVRTSKGWTLNGRKIWISKAGEADFTIAMAASSRDGEHGGISAFLVDRGTPGFNVLRRIPMIGGLFTYEIAFEDCQLPEEALLGAEGQGFAPMQGRLAVRRLQMGAWCVGIAQRALDILIEHAGQRKTFGALLAQRQAIQWWAADAAASRVLRQPMMVGLFLPIQSGGWSPSTLPRTTDWSFEYNSALAQHAEALGLDLVFGLAQWVGKGGHGGTTRYRETSIDSFLTVGALAAVTKRILLISTVHVLYGPWHPLHMAKFGATLDHISGGRWGLNVVTGLGRFNLAQDQAK